MQQLNDSQTGLMKTMTPGLSIFHNRVAFNPTAPGLPLLSMSEVDYHVKNSCYHNLFQWWMEDGQIGVYVTGGCRLGTALHQHLRMVVWCVLEQAVDHALCTPQSDQLQRLLTRPPPFLLLPPPLPQLLVSYFTFSYDIIESWKIFQ